MNLESLALFGEFIGGMAVLITIIYLAYQARQNRMLLEQSVRQQTASMLRANVGGWNSMLASILVDERSVELYDRIKRGADISEGDRQRAEILTGMIFLNLDNLIFQNRMTPFGTSSEKDVELMTQRWVRAALSSTVLKDWWNRENVSFSAEFRKIVDGMELGDSSAVS